MTAEIISVGTELLLGNILNTNAQYLSRELAELGITVQRESTIGDNQGRLADFVNEAKNRCDLLVFTGGLGPTADDLTKETVAACYGDTLVFDESEWEKITGYFARSGRVTTPNNRKQAMPTGKQNSFANRTLPDAVYVTLREDQPVNLCGAFEKPVRKSPEGYAEPSKTALKQYAQQVYACYADAPAQSFAVGIGLDELAPAMPLNQMLTALERAVKEKLPGNEV